ncbi:MAG: PAS domain S-box-containing protein [Crocinitomicaceae bacterium]|jgi:PAS domain S-box-containing protein
MDAIQYGKIFERSSEGLLVANNQGIIEAVNPKLLDMFGYVPGELEGQKIEVLIPQSARTHHVKLREGYTKKPVSRSMGEGSNLKAKRKDNSEFSVEISLSHYQDKDELKVMAFVVDISKRVEVENALVRLNEELENKVDERTHELNQQNKLLLSISKNFPNGNIYVLNSDYRIIWADGQLLRDSGLNENSLVGISFVERLPLNLKNEIEQHLQLAFQGETINTEIANEDRYYSLYAVPLELSPEEDNSVLLVEMDVTDSKKNELEILRTLEKEKELNEMKSRFVSMASHEFRTPLSSIVSSATLIGKYTDGDQQDKRDKHIRRIERSVSNLTAILNDFLSLDKLEEGKTNILLESIEIKPFIQEIIEEMSVVKKEGQVIDYVHSGDVKSIKSDARLLKNSILNLTSNACKYSTETDTIELRTMCDSEVFKLTIKDHGIGIPEEEQKQLFTRFFRANNVTNVQGTGLGLNIVKKYINLLGGTISFESVEGEGTTFKMSIPLDTNQHE